MKVIERINELKKEIEILSSKNPFDEYRDYKDLLKYKLLNPKDKTVDKTHYLRDLNIQLPSLNAIQEIITDKIDKIWFRFAPLAGKSYGEQIDIDIYFKKNYAIYLNDLECCDIHSKSIIELKTLFESEEGYWLEEVLGRNELVMKRFHKQVRTGIISTKLLLSFFNKENIEYIRDNNVRLYLGREYNDRSIDDLIELANEDEFIKTYISYKS